MNNIPVRIFWLVAAFAVISSCGIPTSGITRVLGAPEEDPPPTVTGQTVTFRHNFTDNNIPDFLGYEIYYKFYPYLAVPADGGFGADLSVLRDAPPGSGTATVTGRGFRRIWKASDTVANLPLIPLDDGDPDTLDPTASTDFYVKILFPDRPSASSPDPAVAHFVDVNEVRLFPDRSIEPVRDPAAAPGPSGETFESDDISTNPNDPDIPAGIPLTDDRIHMAVVILAYGIDYTGGTFQPIYSDPLMLDQPLEIILK